MSFSIAFGSTRSSTNWRTVACTSRCSGVSSKSTASVYARAGWIELATARRSCFPGGVRKGVLIAVAAAGRSRRSPGPRRRGPDRDRTSGSATTRRSSGSSSTSTGGRLRHAPGPRRPIPIRSTEARGLDVDKLGIDTDAAPESAHGVAARLVTQARTASCCGCSSDPPPLQVPSLRRPPLARAARGRPVEGEAADAGRGVSRPRRRAAA